MRTPAAFARCGASGRWPASPPPDSAADPAGTVFRCGQIQPESSRFQADKKQPALRVVLKALHSRSRSRSLRRGTRRRCPLSSRRSRTILNRLVNCENTSVLCPSSATSERCASSTSFLALGSPLALQGIRADPGWQAACRSRRNLRARVSSDFAMPVGSIRLSSLVIWIVAPQLVI